MAKKSPIEVELLEAAEISGAKEGESRTKYLTRLMKAVQELPDKEWDKLTDEAQDWVNGSQAAINKKKEPEDFPDAVADKADEDDRPRRRAAKDEDDEDDEKPAKKSSKADEDDEEDRPRRKAKDEDDEDEDKPARKASKEDDEDEDKPRRSRARDEDEEDKPARSKAKDEDDDDKPRRRSREQSSDDDKDEKPAKKENGGEKKGGVAAILGMVTENMDWSKEKVLKKIVAEGYDISEATVGIQYSTAHRIMKLLHEAGHLKGYPAAGDKD